MSKPRIKSTVSRKEDHLKITLAGKVNSLTGAGWDQVRLPHRALPELDASKISLSTRFLGFEYRAPFLISSMTGGSPSGEKINDRLAKHAQEWGIPMGVGSQRVQLENRNKRLFNLRKVAPKSHLWANIGAVQFNYGVSVDDCLWLVDQLQAQALILHCNPLQEAIQAEGNRNFSDIASKITLLRKKLPSKTPLILKETGCGIDLVTAQMALACGVDAIDIAGLGGTHWGFIEGLRSAKRKALGDMFQDWGLPTVDLLTTLRATLGPDIPLIVSGGVRSGLDAAKGLFVGGDLAGMALPFLQAAHKGDRALQECFELHCEAFKVALFCTGSASVGELKVHGQEAYSGVSQT